MGMPKKFTDEQIIEALKLIHAGKSSYRKEAEKLGTAHNLLLNREKTLAKKGIWVASESVLNKAAPAPYYLKRRSEYTSKDGATCGWNIYEPDKLKQDEMMREAIEALKSEIEPTAPIPAPAKQFNSDLCNLYVTTDYHLGMMSWHEETGADWDVKIAEDMLVNWYGQAIATSSNAKTAILANIGDFLHWDGMDAVTPQSRHLLDADTRFQKLVRIAIRVWRRVITMLLQKYDTVHVLMCDANHDPASGTWLREMIDAFYCEEPRVTVDVSPDTYYCHEFGDCSLFFHHGHKRKPANIDTVFTAKFREVFGRTKFSYAHMGHLHSVDMKETNLMIVEQHRTLAAPDAYSSRGGWISGRDSKVITYHKRYGEVARLTISADMVK
jgi:hypothetical protein